MANRQIGWSQESNLLWQIGNQIDRFEKVIFTSLSNTVPSSRTLTINGVTYDLSADRSWTVAGGISGSGAAGQIAYWTGVSSQSGNNNFFWDSVNYRLGIGTNTPSASLRISRAAAGDIISTGLASAVTFSVYSDGFTTTQFLDSVNYIKTPIYRSRGTNLSFASEVGTIYARIFEATGNLVLQNGGTFTDAGFRLDVNGTARVSDTFTAGTNTFTNKLNAQFGTFGIQSFAINNGFMSDNMFYNGSTWTRIASGYAFGFQFYDGQVLFHGAASGSGAITQNIKFKFDYEGAFAIGNNLVITQGGYSGATALFTKNGRLLLGTTTENNSAILNVTSTTQGFLPPRMTNAQRAAISSPAVGLIVYCTDATEGLYQYINNAWVNISGVVTNRQTASYTLALGDSNDLVEMNVATANNLTVPLDSAVAFPVGTKIDIAQYGAGQTTVVATGGVTVRSAGGALKLAAQYSGATLVKIATNEWYLFGDITV